MTVARNFQTSLIVRRCAAKLRASILVSANTMTFLFYCVILKNRTKIFEYEENEDILINISGKTNK